MVFLGVVQFSLVTDAKLKVKISVLLNIMITEDSGTNGKFFKKIPRTKEVMHLEPATLRVQVPTAISLPADLGGVCPSRTPAVSSQHLSWSLVSRVSEPEMALLKVT